MLIYDVCFLHNWGAVAKRQLIAFLQKKRFFAYFKKRRIGAFYRKKSKFKRCLWLSDNTDKEPQR